MPYLFCLLAGSRVNLASLPRTRWARKDKVDKNKVDKNKVDKNKVDKDKVDKDKVDKDNVDKDKEDKDKVGQLNPVATRLCNLETMK